MKPLGIYIHVPFCKQKCVYCDFYSLPRREEDMDAYAAALRAQLAETDFSGYEADTVYFGGGVFSKGSKSPSIMPEMLFETTSCVPFKAVAAVRLPEESSVAEKPKMLS